MARRYTNEEKQQVLDRLIENKGDVARTAEETGVNMRTIYRWQKSEDDWAATLTTLTTSRIRDDVSVGADRDVPNAPAEEHQTSEVHPDDAEILRDLQQQMLDHAYLLIDSIPAAIEDAPLNQVVAALSQLIDRIIKLSTQLPQEPTEMTIRFEYEDPEDDPAYHAAPEPEEDYP